METKIKYEDGCYYDQIANDGTWLTAHEFSWYIWNKYKLTTTQYVSLIDYGDKDYIPKCPICGNDLTIHRVRFGFQETCSASCRGTLTAKRLVESGKHNFLGKKFN